MNNVDGSGYIELLEPDLMPQLNHFQHRRHVLDKFDTFNFHLWLELDRWGGWRAEFFNFDKSTINPI